MKRIEFFENLRNENSMIRLEATFLELHEGNDPPLMEELDLRIFFQTFEVPLDDEEHRILTLIFETCFEMQLEEGKIKDSQYTMTLKILKKKKRVETQKKGMKFLFLTSFWAVRQKLNEKKETKPNSRFRKEQSLEQSFVSKIWERLWDEKSEI